jgi:hypothetical protein
MNDQGPRVTRLQALLCRRFTHLLGLMVVLPLVAVDPAMIVLVYDAEFLALLGSVGLALLCGDVRILWRRVRDSLLVTELRVATALTRERPRSLLEC